MAVPIKNINRYTYDVDFYDLTSVNGEYINSNQITEQDKKRLERAYDSGNFETYVMPNGVLAPDYFEPYYIENPLTYILRLINRDTLSRDGFVVDEFDQMKTAEYTPILELAPYRQSKLRDRVIKTGSPTLQVVSGEYQILTGAGEELIFETAAWGRYLPALVGLPGLGIRIQSRTAGSVIKWGYFHLGTGFYFRLDDNGWAAVVEDEGVVTFEKYQEDWDDPLDGTGLSGRVLTYENGIVSRWPFIWYGYGPIIFQVLSKNGKEEELIDVCRAVFENKISISKPNRPVAVEVIGEAEVYVGGRQYGVYGRYSPEFRNRHKRRESLEITQAWRPIMGFLQDPDEESGQVMVKFDDIDALGTVDIVWEVHVDPDQSLTAANFTVTDNETAVYWNVTFGTTGVARNGIPIASGMVPAGVGASSGFATKNIPSIPLPKDLPIVLFAKARSGAGSGTGTFTMSTLEEW